MMASNMHLTHLPIEIIQNILFKQDTKTILDFCQTSTVFVENIYNDNVFWKTRFQREYGMEGQDIGQDIIQDLEKIERETCIAFPSYEHKFWRRTYCIWSRYCAGKSIAQRISTYVKQAALFRKDEWMITRLCRRWNNTTYQGDDYWFFSYILGLAIHRYPKMAEEKVLNTDVTASAWVNYAVDKFDNWSLGPISISVDMQRNLEGRLDRACTEGYYIFAKSVIDTPITLPLDVRVNALKLACENGYFNIVVLLMQEAFPENDKDSESPIPGDEDQEVQETLKTIAGGKPYDRILRYMS
jgi:hypothetical protein